ncbi:MAG TPA: hypothetical protein VJ347_15940, partial [Streptosporangiaceae bacterium]|nr:hypothetical protein [Streptosporangiaceae bacterium]
MKKTADAPGDPSRPPPELGVGVGPGVALAARAGQNGMAGRHRFVVVASRLPVDRVEGPDGQLEWQPSPGGLVTALEPVMRKAGGAWIGWSGDAGPAPGAFEADGLALVGLALSETEVRHFYEGFCNATL